MSLLAQVGTFTSPAATGNQTVPLDNAIWGGASPKAVLIWSSVSAVDGIAAHSLYGFGVAVAGSQSAISTKSHNAVTTTVARRRHTNLACISAFYTTASDAIEEASLVSFSANQFTVNWSAVSGTGILKFHFLALGGADLQANLKQIQSPAGTGQVAYTGVGFQPDAILVFSVNDLSLPPATDVNAAALSLGFADGLSQNVSAATSQAAVTTSGTARKQVNRIVAYPWTDGNDYHSASRVSLDADGYTLDWHVGGSRYIWVLALKGIQAKVLAANQPASNDSLSRSIGFAPKAVIFSSFMGPTAATIQNDARIGIGAWDASNNMAFAGAVDEHGQVTTDADRIQDSNEALKHIDHTQTVVGSMSAAANGNDLVETWTDCDGTQREHGMLVLGASPTSAVFRRTLYNRAGSRGVME